MTTPSLIARRRRHGPEPLPEKDRRAHCVSVRLNPTELAQLDAKRGRLARGEGCVPPPCTTCRRLRLAPLR